MMSLSTRVLVCTSLFAGIVAKARPSSHFQGLLQMRGGSSGSSSADDPVFDIISENKVYDGKYRQILQKEVKFPTGKINTFDIMSNNGLPSVSCFCWDVQKKCTTLVKEYHPGADQFMYGTINGQYEANEGGKHTSAKECASFELAEEAQLEAQAEDFISMLDEGSSSSMDKYTDNRLHPFLILNPQSVSEENARAMDDEEFIHVVPGLDYYSVMDLIATGKINVVSSYTILLGWQTLEKLGIEYK